MQDLEAINYYRQYGAGLNRDLDEMHGVLKHMELPEELLGNLRARKAASFLVLGSATPRNADAMALIDRVLRPGQGDADTVTFIDRNAFPMQQHQKHHKFLADWKQSYKPSTRPNSNIPELLYPYFNVSQADIRSLPFVSQSKDCVVSDYTLNFLDTQVDVGKTLGEASRVLTRGGVMLLAVTGNSAAGEMPEVYTYESRLKVQQFHPDTYVALAAANGLHEVAAVRQGDDLLCGVFEKRS